MSVNQPMAGSAIEGRELARSLEKMVDFKLTVNGRSRRLGGDPHLLNDPA
jgi:hypothetical protein